MTENSLEKLLSSLVQHISDLRDNFKNLEEAISKLPHEIAPDLRPDLKEIHKLCTTLAHGDGLRKVIAEKAEQEFFPLRAIIASDHNELKRQLVEQIQILSQGLKRLSFSFNQRSATIGVCLAVGLFALVFGSGYLLCHYQDIGLVERANRDLSYSTTQYELAKYLELEGLEMIKSNKVLKQFTDNGNKLVWFKCKGEGQTEGSVDGRRVCKTTFWLDPLKK